MKVYLIILLIHFNSIVSQLLNNESLFVYQIQNRGLFTAKFGKTINQIKESESKLLIENNNWFKGMDYSLSANVIIWRDVTRFGNSWFDVLYAIPINKR
jgi:hypothetical protein